MRAMLLGARGMLGRDLIATSPASVQLLAFSKTDLDITHPETVRSSIHHAKPDVLINASGYTKVDQAETDNIVANAVNHDAVSRLAEFAKEAGTRLVHFSTDYVFDGTSELPYSETDAAHPINVYGTSKLRGEMAIQASGALFLIIRTQWLFGLCGRSFPRTMHDRAQRGKTSRVVQDQIGRPTYTVDLACATWALIAANATGIVHAANSGIATWFEVARHVYSSLGLSHLVQPCTTAEFPTPAPRPPHSVLDTSRMERLLGYSLPHWSDALDRFLIEATGRQ